MLSEFSEYLFAFLDKWLFWVGIVFLVPELLKTVPSWKHGVEKLPRKVFWLLSAACLFVASFQLWHEQRVRVKEGAVYLRPTAIAPLVRADAFPVGQPLSLNVAWTVFGQKPAQNVFLDGQAYLESDTQFTTQKRIVSDFQIKWEEFVNRVKDKEHSTVFPGDRAETLARTFRGPVISEADKLDIKFGRKFVFIIGAARFADSLGVHEAHVCRWLETHADGQYGSIAWHDCQLWISPIDIER